jgi:starch phosphorylase
MNNNHRFDYIPERIRGLGRLAFNLWWSWHPSARALFWALDLQSWHESGHNPLKMLTILPPDVLATAASDPDFLARYDAVMERFEHETESSAGPFTAEFGHLEAPIAYFSAEYGLHVTLPLYAGGLGILAGDYLKECSDLAIPVVAVGLSYSRGYVTQRIREDGSPEDVRETLDRTHNPITQLTDDNGAPLLIQVPIFDPPVYVAVWKVSVGRIPLYLLDTDIEINAPWDRAISHHLYAATPEQRLRQEIVLGMGGVRVLEVLGIRPSALHINEGHPALAVLQRMRPMIEEGISFEEALGRVRETSIFTTHTPISAGTDIFPAKLIEKYFATCCRELGIGHDVLVQMGINPKDSGAGFNMTVFALRASRYCNAVSKRHGEVARDMWAHIWPGAAPENVPIEAITNGVHLPTWIDPLKLQPLLDQYLGPDWIEHQDDPEVWKRVDDIPDEEIWRIHTDLKVRMIDYLNKRIRERWQERMMSAESAIASGALLETKVLTLGFARRFTSYKRPDLLLHDVERLRRLLLNSWHPVQIIFAGKAHPADIEGKRLIQKIYRLAQDYRTAGRIAFVEDFEQSLSSYLVRGVDIWLNNPLPPMEASGTSGMKASVNGTLNLSIMDGWWVEGYNEGNGWAFGGENVQGDRTPADAESLYRILEDRVVPLYYKLSNGGIPAGFVRMMKESIKSVAPYFSTRRMVKEYVHRFYLNAVGKSR